MSDALDQVWLAGVDACRGGWIAAFVRPTGEYGQPRVFCRFADILAAPERPLIIAIDVPIGLPERGGRNAENAIRPQLGKLQRSVFPIPSRRAVFAELGPLVGQKAIYAAHQRACAVAVATSEPPKRIPIQTFGIFPKIREVDTALRNDIKLIKRVHETHPELAFWQINGRCPLNDSKKTDAGLAIRRQLLIDAGVPPNIARNDPPKRSKPDDMLDALVCATVARRIHTGIAESFPNPPSRDEFNLPMAIWA
jgi:predicted RNase H-like nuclease